MSNSEQDKGGRFEEALRRYFLAQGYFVVRGVPLSYDGFDITDLDLWLYLRSTPISRQRFNVDAKRRATPKALERVLWAKGLQAVLGLEGCIVATTDKRRTVKEFGQRHDVVVLDGTFLNRLESSRVVSSESRLSEEEFLDLVLAGRDDNLLGNWKGRLLDARKRLVTRLEFDGCNGWLEDIRFFIEQSQLTGSNEGACRLAYVVTSYLLVGVDFSLRTLAFEDVERRRSALEEGFRHGTSGKLRTDETIKMATTLLDNYAPEVKGLGARLRSHVQRDLDSMPVEILAEYFAKVDVSRDLFTVARLLEDKAYSRTFSAPGNLEAGAQAVLGVLLDFHGIDRRAFLK